MIHQLMICIGSALVQNFGYRRSKNLIYDPIYIYQSESSSKTLIFSFEGCPAEQCVLVASFGAQSHRRELKLSHFEHFFEHSSKANWTELVISHFQLWKIWRKKLDEKVLRNGHFSLAPSYNALQAGAGILAMESNESLSMLPKFISFFCSFAFLHILP